MSAKLVGRPSLRKVLLVGLAAPRTQSTKSCLTVTTGMFPTRSRPDFYAAIDRFLVNQLDTDFMDEINRFFMASLGE